MNRNITKQTIINKSIILVDTSYTSFYRFFATLRWYGFAYPEEFKELKTKPDYDWVNNKIFMEKYEKMYLDSIIKLVKKKVFDNSIIIFCMDSPKEQLWRTQLQCNYKGDRADLSLKHNFKSVFNYTYTIMIPQFIKSNTNIYSMRVEKMEADDIIAIICMHMKIINPTQPVYLVSGDADFLQLGRDNLIFINYKAKKPFTLTEIEATTALKHKILLGDSSDCIPSIFPKGVRLANKKEILESNDKLTIYLESTPVAKKQYDINKKMIDFSNIPKLYVNKIIKLFEKTIYLPIVVGST
jgi:5'-3' exonuclease